MNLPQAFVEKYQALLGEEAAAFFEALQKDYQKGFRLNQKKVTSTDFLKEQLPLSKKSPYSTQGYYGEVAGKTPWHQAGWVYSQEISAMLVAEVAEILPGQRVLDLCAAPGGKTTRLGEKLQGKGVLVANEIFPKRAKVLSENIERYGLENVLVTNHAPKELAKHFQHYFDVIVVDAPCSGEGMFQKEPEALTQWSDEYVQICQKRQMEILMEANKMLKPGGQLVYSTCTFAPEEDEEVIDFLLDTEEFDLEKITDIPTDNVCFGRPTFSRYGEEIQKTIRLWPHINKGAGHFVAKLQKKTTLDNIDTPKKEKKKKSKKETPSFTKEETRSLEQFLKDFPIPLENGHYEVTGGHLWYVPNDLPSLKGLHYLRKGLYIGDFLKNRFVPSYSLAMVITDYQTYPHVMITFEEWKKYVRGETFVKEGDLGFVLLVYEEMVVGFGKQTKGTVKNYFPKGLRMNHL